MSKANQYEAAIRAAMDRLLKGDPIRSDGRLTAATLGAESGVARWRLYGEHRHLLDEFRTRAALQDNTPRALRDLQEKHAKLKKRHIGTRNKLAQSVADVKRLSCVVNVLALENAQLKERLNKPNPRVTEMAPRIEAVTAGTKRPTAPAAANRE